MEVATTYIVVGFTLTVEVVAQTMKCSQLMAQSASRVQFTLFWAEVVQVYLAWFAVVMGWHSPHEESALLWVVFLLQVMIALEQVLRASHDNSCSLAQAPF